MKNIKDIVEIKFGFYAQIDKEGEIPYLQVKQFDEYGILKESADEFIKLDRQSEQHLLKDGDVLFVGKGSRLFAWCYRQTAGHCIASSIFFILRPKQKLIYPEYLATILNAPSTKQVFQQIGSGTNIFSIRKSELGALKIPLPSMEKQKKIAAIAQLHQKEFELMQELLIQKQNLFQGIISKFLNQNLQN